VATVGDKVVNSLCAVTHFSDKEKVSIYDGTARNRVGVVGECNACHRYLLCCSSHQNIKPCVCVCVCGASFCGAAVPLLLLPAGGSETDCAAFAFDPAAPPAENVTRLAGPLAFAISCTIDDRDLTKLPELDPYLRRHHHDYLAVRGHGRIHDGT
jgi:hypothetical protein